MIDPKNEIVELDENNNIGIASIYVEHAERDVVLSNFILPKSMAAGNHITVAVDLTNIGNSSFPQSIMGFYLSADSVYDSLDIYIGQKEIGTLNKGYTRNEILSLKIPDSVAAGNYHVFGYLDPYNDIRELNENNNLISGKIDIEEYGTYFITPYHASNTIKTCGGTIYDNGFHNNYQSYSADTL